MMKSIIICEGETDFTLLQYFMIKVYAEIIRKGNDFVDIADPDSKYLKHRSLKTKAKFDVYFSIRTAAKQFRMRQDILKNVPWEDYENIREVFKELSKLG